MNNAFITKIVARQAESCSLELSKYKIRILHPNLAFNFIYNMKK